MAIEFHVNGLAKIYIGAEYLGYSSEAGVQLEFEPKFLPIHTDAYGDQTPEDIQNMGMTASISFELIRWDQAILTKLQAFYYGTSGSKGNTPNSPTGASAAESGTLLIGSLLKQCGWSFVTQIQRWPPVTGCEGSPEGAYKFNTCYLGADSFNLGTKATRHKLSIHCIPNASGQLFTVSSVNA